MLVLPYFCDWDFNVSFFLSSCSAILVRFVCVLFKGCCESPGLKPFGEFILASVSFGKRTVCPEYPIQVKETLTLVLFSPNSSHSLEGEGYCLLLLCRKPKLPTHFPLMLTKWEESSVASAAAGCRWVSGPQWGKKVPPGVLLLLGCPEAFCYRWVGTRVRSCHLVSAGATASRQFSLGHLLLLGGILSIHSTLTTCWWGRKVPFLGCSELSATIW